MYETIETIEERIKYLAKGWYSKAIKNHEPPNSEHTEIHTLQCTNRQ